MRGANALTTAKLYFFRHGDAGDKSAWSGDDRERPLSPIGRIEAQGVSSRLAEMRFAPEVIITSPLARASQTAEILAAELPGVPLLVDNRLAPGFAVRELAELLAENRDARRIVFVGHDPAFSSVIESVTGARIRIRKGGLARVEIDDESGPSGVLTWLATPRLMGVEDE
ncbi:MAG: histidine phosphatase family protein [Actinobacteria bacterium]|nr:MAG: histidine phosphatase family protein [Actinomycetota bacterium]